MSLRKFSLIPFPGEDPGRGLSIIGAIGRRRTNRLPIRCALLGNLSELSIPARDKFPGRKERLWDETCLELFLGMADSERYWEFNLSPAGHWNVYRFTSCREGMREEPTFSSLPFGVRREPGALRVSLDLDIGKIVPSTEAIEAAVCAVVKTLTGGTSHWALAHPGPRPDFHRRDTFKLVIPGE